MDNQRPVGLFVLQCRIAVIHNRQRENEAFFLCQIIKVRDLHLGTLLRIGAYVCVPYVSEGRAACSRVLGASRAALEGPRNLSKPYVIHMDYRSMPNDIPRKVG